MGRKGFLRGNARSLDHGIYLKKYVLVTLLRINVHMSRTYIFWTDSSIMAQQGAGIISPTLSNDFYHRRIELQGEGNNQSDQCDCGWVTVKELQSLVLYMPIGRA